MPETLPAPQAARALLDLVEADRARRCDEISTLAETTARALLAEARASALARARTVMAAERARLHERLRALDARLATESRLHAQRRVRALLDEAWRRLPIALEARWRDPAGRREWTRQVLASARADLGPDDWALSYAPGWREDERRDALEELAAAGFAIAAVTGDEQMRAGLQVRHGGNVLDGTLQGLLADRKVVAARILDELSRSAP
ncbi:MAG: hypothetical protein ABIQ72_12385 [Usitatibacter sp.]